MNILIVSSENDAERGGYFNAVKQHKSLLINKRLDNKKFFFLNLVRKGWGISIKRPAPAEWVISYPKVICSKWPISSVERCLAIALVFLFAKKQKADIIHSHWGYPTGLASAKVAHYLNIKSVITYHGSDIHTFPLQNKAVFKYTREALRIASRNVFVSKSLFKKSEKILDSDKAGKYTVIYNSLPARTVGFLKKYKALKEQECESDHSNNIHIGYVGTLNYTKGADLLPEILSKLRVLLKERSDDRQVFLSIVGEGPLFDTLRERFEFDSQVELKGGVRHDDVFGTLAMMDCVVIPSRNEGFGLVAVETLALGIPCVAANVGGLSEVYDGNEKLLTNGSSADDYAEKILEIVTDSVIVNSKKVIEKFSEDFMLERYIEVYEDLVYDKI